MFVCLCVVSLLQQLLTATIVITKLIIRKTYSRSKQPRGEGIFDETMKIMILLRVSGTPVDHGIEFHPALIGWAGSSTILKKHD